MTVPISDADSFFGTLEEQVLTLAQSQRQNPVCVDMLVNRAKRYLSKPEYRIQLADLVSEEVERIIDRLDQHDMALNGSANDEDILRRITIYDGVSEGLTKVCGLIGRWGDPSQIAIVVDAIKRILNFADVNRAGNCFYIDLRRYPAVLAYHACTLGLQYAEKWAELHDLMGLEVQSRHGHSERLLEVVGPSSWEGSKNQKWTLLPEMKSNITPFNDHLANEIFAAWGTSFLPPRVALAEMTLLNEALTAIQYLETESIKDLQDAMAKPAHKDELNYIQAPIGRASWSPEYKRHILPRFENSDLKKHLAEGGFGGGCENFISTALENYTRILGPLRWR